MNKDGIVQAIKSADMGLILDAPSVLKSTIDKDTGFLIAPVTLARTGVQQYYGYELGLEDRTLEKIGVFRSPSEVFDPQSVQSFINLVATDDHPNNLVTIDNVKTLQVGSVSEVKPVRDTLVGVATITDKDEIEKIQKGKKEVSVGYSNDLIEKSGLYNGDSYEFMQTNIRANHLAIVDAGRCGSACKLTMDEEKKEKSMVILIDGIKYDVTDDQLAQAIQKQQSAFDAEKEEMKKKLDEAEEEKEELKKDKDKAEATKDALEKSVLGDEAINKLVSDRAVLLTTAKAILQDSMPECVDCPREIMAAVADHVLGMKDLSDKSDDYLTAVYDAAVEKVKKAKGTLDNLTSDFLSKDKTENIGTDRAAIRQKHCKDQLGLEV